MKSANIITVGNEILSGQITDTNSNFITSWLFDLGIEVTKKITVRDKIDEIVDAFKGTVNTDIIIATGGLGPTEDDLTKEALSKFLDKRLIFDENEWNKICGIFKKKRGNEIIPESNKKQAFMIEGGYFLSNDLGTASGIYYETNNGIIYILLPGPPPENQFIINKHLKEKFASLNSHKNIKKQIFRIYNSSESFINDLLRDIWNNDSMGIYVQKEGYIKLDIKMINDDEILFNDLIDKIEDKFKKNDIFYTDDIELSKKVFDILETKNLSISFAESITGGSLLGEFISKNSEFLNTSKVIIGGIVAYSDFAKIEILGIKKEIIEKYDVVSKEVVTEMAKGIGVLFPDTDISIAVSGNANGKQMGLLYFSFIFGKKKFVHEKKFFGITRDQIIQKSIIYIYSFIYQYYSSKLKKNEKKMG